jgi:hypothetical protein
MQIHFKKNQTQVSSYILVLFLCYFQMLELGTGSSEIKDKMGMVRRKCFIFPMLGKSLIRIRNHCLNADKSFKFALTYYVVYYTIKETAYAQQSCF